MKKIMLGTNATVTIGRCGYVIRYLNDRGDMLSIHDFNKTVLPGDSVVVPFFAKMSVDDSELNRSVRIDGGLGR